MLALSDWISKLVRWFLFIGLKTVLAMKMLLLRKSDDWEMLRALLNGMPLLEKIDNKNLSWYWFMNDLSHT